MISSFKNEASIYIVPIDVNLDTVNNMGTEEVEINVHNHQTKAITKRGGHVHPSDSGCWQIADEMYYFIRCMEEERINGN